MTTSALVFVRRGLCFSASDSASSFTGAVGVCPRFRHPGAAESRAPACLSASGSRTSSLSAGAASRRVFLQLRRLRYNGLGEKGPERDVEVLLCSEQLATRTIQTGGMDRRQ